MAGSANSLYDAKVAPTGGLRVFRDPGQLFVDTYDGTSAIDTVNRYVTPTSGGTGTIASNTTAQVTLNGGTTLNSFSLLQTQATFKPRDPAYLLVEHHPNIEYPILTTGYRFWGLATTPASPTIANPIIEGAGFEVFTDGHIYAVTYQTNVRTFIQDITAFYPSSSAPARLFMFFRGDSIKWSIGSLDNVVAEMFTGAPGPNVNQLPKTMLAVSGGGVATVLTDNNATVSDTASGNTTISDGIFGFRTATVGAQGGLGVSLVDGFKSTYSASVTGLVGVAGDVFIINGSATKTIRVTHVEFSGIATAAADMDISLVKRSTADTAGTVVASTPHDSTSTAATAVVNSFTAAPTPGSIVGTPVRAVKSEIGTAAVQGELQVWDFGNRPSQAVVLRGVAQGLALNVGATQAGASYDISFEWTEE